MSGPPKPCPRIAPALERSNHQLTEHLFNRLRTVHIGAVLRRVQLARMSATARRLTNLSQLLPPRLDRRGVVAQLGIIAGLRAIDKEIVRASNADFRSSEQSGALLAGRRLGGMHPY